MLHSCRKNDPRWFRHGQVQHLDAVFVFLIVVVETSNGVNLFIPTNATRPPTSFLQVRQTGPRFGLGAVAVRAVVVVSIISNDDEHVLVQSGGSTKGSFFGRSVHVFNLSALLRNKVRCSTAQRQNVFFLHSDCGGHHSSANDWPVDSTEGDMFSQEWSRPVSFK